MARLNSWTLSIGFFKIGKLFPLYPSPAWHSSELFFIFNDIINWLEAVVGSPGGPGVPSLINTSVLGLVMRGSQELGNKPEMIVRWTVNRRIINKFNPIWSEPETPPLTPTLSSLLLITVTDLPRSDSGEILQGYNSLHHTISTASCDNGSGIKYFVFNILLKLKV